MLDTAATIVFILLGVMMCIGLAGFIHGTYKQWRGDDVDVTNTTEALISAQGKRMDVEDSLRSDDGDSS